MDDREREHPDEGTIHAWLDGALDDGAARALAAHVAACPACAERVAEARGLIAGASRIVSALDDAPSAGPVWGQAPAAATTVSPRTRRLLRVTPARAAIAATVLVALGVSLTYRRGAVESHLRPTDTLIFRDAAGQRAERAAPAMAPATAPASRDPLLDSAIARNVAKALPPRAVEAAPGPAIPVPPPTSIAAAPDPVAPARVAAGRAAMQADRAVGKSAAPDQLAGRSGGAAPIPDDRAVAAAARVDSVSVPSSRAMASAPAGPVMRPQVLRIPAECYRVESANGIAARWGADALPLVVRVDSARRATVLTSDGRATGSQATVTRADDDSLLLRLRRIGYEGTLALGAPGDARAGVMRSRLLTTALSEVVATAAPAEDAPSERRRSAAKAPAARPAPQTQASPEARSEANAAPALPVVARRISCPG